MTDERHPGSDDAEGDERPDTHEPEFGSSEWLLQQLTGGRRVARPAEQADAADTPDAGGVDAPDAGAPDAPDADTPDAPAVPAAHVAPENAPVPSHEPEAAEPTVALPVIPEAAEPTVALPVVPETEQHRSDEAPNAQDTFELFLNPVVEPELPAEGPVQPEQAAEPVEEPEQGSGFSWHLTPGVGTDPLVDEPAQPASSTVWHLDDTSTEQAETPDESAPVAEPVAEPIAPAAPAVPPVIPVPSFDSYESSSHTESAEPEAAEPERREPTPPDTTTFEPPSFYESLRLPQPPVWNIDAEPAVAPEPTAAEPAAPVEPAVAPELTAAEPAAPVEPTSATPDEPAEPPLFRPSIAVPVTPEPVPAQPAPAQEAEPEPEPEPEPAPEPEPTSAGEPEEESHGLAALLGFFGEDDEEPTSTSRSVIGDTTGIIPIPPGALTPPEAAPAAPAAFTPPAPPVPPTPPVLPPPDASRLFEPTATPEPSQADVPTAKLDTAEIAALLRARPGDPEPGEPEPSELAPTDTDSIPDVPPATVPPIEEATLLLGALPSPATQPLDAESIGEASEPAPFTGSTAAVDAGAPDDHDSEQDDDTRDTDEEGQAPTAATILFPELASPATAETIALAPPVAPAAPAPVATGQTPTASGPTPPRSGG
ncbi:hypothetical protein, partial [Leifsonia sp. NCR5]|uniref:hypothetical protein n=1 Tax=Leifsonia sp. NCR5 TaxID=1978342 RepID=UPI00356B71A2